MIAPFKSDLSDTDRPQSVVMGNAPATTIKAASSVQRAIAVATAAMIATGVVAFIVSWQLDDPYVISAILIAGTGFAFMVGWIEVNRESRAHAKAVDRKAYSEQAATESSQRMAESTHEARLEVWKESESAKIDLDRARAEVERAKAEPHRVKADIMRRWGETLISRIEAMPMDVQSAVSLLRHTGVDVNGLLPEPSESDHPKAIEEKTMIINGNIDTGATWQLSDGRLASIDLMAKIIRFTHGFQGDARQRLKDKGVAFGNDDFAIANDALVELGVKNRLGDSTKTDWAMDNLSARQAISFIRAGQRPPTPLPSGD